jgi:hypothetical protein
MAICGGQSGVRRKDVSWCLWCLSKAEIRPKRTKHERQLKQARWQKSLICMRFLCMSLKRWWDNESGQGEYPTLSAIFPELAMVNGVDLIPI